MSWLEGFEARRIFFCLLIELGAMYASRAFGAGYGPMVTVNRMSCRQAVAYVRKYGMYWVESQADGPIPITFVTSTAQTCNGEGVLEYHKRPTRDHAECVVGYTCRN